MKAHLRDRAADRERGSASLELVIVAPVFLVLLGALVLGGRLALAQQAVTAAAAEAARTASIARTASAATTAAAAAATRSLSGQGVDCASTQVDVDAAAFAAAVGSPGTVSVHVACTVNLADLSVPGIVGVKVLRATMTSTLDTHRER